MPTAVAAFDNELMEKVSADDRAWFQSNPGKLYRLRDYIPGEFTSDQISFPTEGLGFVLVTKCDEHMRMRQPVYVPKVLMPYIDGVWSPSPGETRLKFRKDTPTELFLEHAQDLNRLAIPLTEEDTKKFAPLSVERVQ